jgi:hypothetical protein
MDGYNSITKDLATVMLGESSGAFTQHNLEGAIKATSTVVSNFRSNDNKHIKKLVLPAYNLVGLNDQDLFDALNAMRVPGQEEFASCIHIKDKFGNITGPFKNPTFMLLADSIRSRIAFEQERYQVSNEELSHNGRNLDGGYRASNIQAALIVIVALMKVDPSLPPPLREQINCSRRQHLRLINALAALVPEPELGQNST